MRCLLYPQRKKLRIQPRIRGKTSLRKHQYPTSGSFGPQFCIEHCLAITRTEHVVHLFCALFHRSSATRKSLQYAQMWVRAVNITIVRAPLGPCESGWLCIFPPVAEQNETLGNDRKECIYKDSSAVLVSSASSSEGYEYGPSVTAAVCSLSNTESHKQRHWLSRR